MQSIPHTENENQEHNLMQKSGKQKGILEKEWTFQEKAPKVVPVGPGWKRKRVRINLEDRSFTTTIWVKSVLQEDRNSPLLDSVLPVAVRKRPRKDVLEKQTECQSSIVNQQYQSLPISNSRPSVAQCHEQHPRTSITTWSNEMPELETEVTMQVPTGFIAHTPNRVSALGYSCVHEGCNATFKNKTALRKHTLVHAPKDHECEVCGKGFRENSKLRRHHLTHTKEKPFKCEYKGCGLSFALRGNLIAHKKVHTGEKKYTCEVCGRCFAHPYNLRMHVGCKHTDPSPNTDNEDEEMPDLGEPMPPCVAYSEYFRSL